jgi:hypothetical protein
MSAGAGRGAAGFFDLERRLDGISAKGDPLETIKATVPWEAFRADIEAVTARNPDSGSPLALIPSSRRSRSKKPGCPTARPRAHAITHAAPNLICASLTRGYFSRCPLA